MTGSFWIDLLLGITAALLLAWHALVVVCSSPGRATGCCAKPCGPARRAAWSAGWPPTRPWPRGVRIRLGLLLAYLAIPIDLIPDFIPVLGYADDAIITAVLRGVLRRAGLDTVRAHWPGTDDGFAAVARLTGLHRPTG